MGVRIANNVWGRLSASISAVDVVIPVDDASLFPALGVGEYSYATLINTSNQLEIVKIISIAGNNLTVERGAESTTARPYTQTDLIEIRVTAQTVYDLFLQNSQDALAAQLAAEAAAASVINNLFWMGVSAGTVDAIEFTAATGGVVSSSHFFIVENTTGENTGAATFKLNTEPVIPLRLSDGEELPAGATGKVGSKMIISINAALDEYILLNPIVAPVVEVDMGLEWHTGLKLTTLNEFVTAYGVNIGAGSVMDDTRTVRITILHPFGFSKDLSLPWAPGTGFPTVGGRAAADAFTANTCYGCFVIAKADGTSDLILARNRANALADPNVIAAGFIYARLVSAVYTGTLAIFNRFIGQGYYEDGNGLQRLNVPVQLTNVISTAGVSIDSRVPPNMIGLFAYRITTQTTGASTDNIVGGVLSNPALVNQAPSPIVNHVTVEVNDIAPFNEDTAVNEFEFKVNNVAQVRHRENQVFNSTFVQIFIRGWRMDWSETDII